MMELGGIIFVVLIIAPAALSVNCTEDQIEKYIVCSANRHRIERAVFPPTRASSLLIKVQVQFVHQSSSSINLTDDCDVLDGIFGDSEYYTWSKACLYVSGGPISLCTMMLFSLGTIWPERRMKELYIRLPHKCRNDLEDEEKMTHFLSKLESLAVRPSAPDPRVNTVKCITKGHGKTTFSGIQKCLDGLCWIVQAVAFGFSLLGTWSLAVYLRVLCHGDAPNATAAWVLIVLITIADLGLSIAACIHSDKRGDYCLFVYCAITFATAAVAAICLIWRYYCKKKSSFCCHCIFVFPSVFMVFHHILWVFLGVITEPLLAFPIILVIICVSFGLYYLTYVYCSTNSTSPRCLLGLFIAFFLSFIFYIIVVTLVGQAFFGQDVIATLVYGILMIVVGMCVNYFRAGQLEEHSTIN